MEASLDGNVVLPLVEEQVRVEKRTVTTGRVRISTRVDSHDQWVHEDLHREDVMVERVPKNEVVDAMPAVREEGDVLVYPVVEEVLVVEKRLVLKEELRISRRRTIEHIEQPVALRRAHAIVDRTGPGPDDSTPH